MWWKALKIFSIITVLSMARFFHSLAKNSSPLNGKMGSIYSLMKGNHGWAATTQPPIQFSHVKSYVMETSSWSNGGAEECDCGGKELAKGCSWSNWNESFGLQIEIW